jgi:hypothetical protein
LNTSEKIPSVNFQNSKEVLSLAVSPVLTCAGKGENADSLGRTEKKWVVGAYELDRENNRYVGSVRGCCIIDKLEPRWG